MTLKKLSQLSFGLILSSTIIVPSYAANQIKAPPNIMIILADDLGFSDISAYGSEIKTPHPHVHNS